MEDTFDFWPNMTTNSSSGSHDDQTQTWNYASYPQDPSFGILHGLDDSSVNNMLEYGILPPIPSQTQPRFTSGSHSSHYPHPIPSQQDTPSTLIPPSQPDPYTNDAQLQLEILRETRRIRELELTIAAEKRRSDEAIMHQREMEVMLATAPSQNIVDPFNSGLNLDVLGALDSWPFATFPSLSDYNTDPSTIYSSPNNPSTDITPNTPPSMFLPNDGPSDVANSQTPYPTASSTPPPTITPALPSLTPNRRRHPHKKEPAIIEERDIFCMRCSKPMVKALLRGTRAELDVQFRPQFQCKDCAPVRQAAVTSSKKRGNELEDTALPTLCVVCTKLQGEGGFVAKDRVPLMFMCEIICISCSHKYKRCSHCGGGTGRIALGKWRCKELFDGNRKTCRLSHEKLGARDMEMSVWEVPGEVQDREEYPAMVEACLNLWTDHHISRAATPEVLEHSPDLKSWEDIHEKIISSGPPAQVLLTQPPLTPYHRHYFALTWAKKQRRRDKSKPEWTRSSAKEKNIAEWVAFNTRKSDVLLPENSVLSSVWYCEWNIKDRTLMTGTLTMFDRGDVDERAGFSVSSIILRILDEIKRHNAELPEDIWEPPEHIWVPPRYARSHLRVKLFELIQRKCGFLPLDEYLGRYPHLNPAIFGPDAGRVASHMFKRRSNIDGSGQQSVVFAKSIGTGWDAEDVKHLMEKELTKMPRGVQI